MKYLKKYSTEAERQAATAIEPSASIVVEDEGVYYDRAWDTPTEPIYANQSPYWTHDWQFIRPAEWPDLDIFNMESNYGLVATYDCRDRIADPDCLDHFIFYSHANSNFTIQRGNVVNGEFVVNATVSLTTNTPYMELLPRNEGDFVVYRVISNNNSYGRWNLIAKTITTDIDEDNNRYPSNNKIVELLVNQANADMLVRPYSKILRRYANYSRVNLANTGMNDLQLGPVIENVEIPNVYNVRSIQKAFQNAFKLKNIPLFSTSSSISNMASAFASCYELEEIPGLESWTGMTNLGGTFYNCYNLKQIDVSSWNTSTLTGEAMQNTFSGCRSVELLDLSGWTFSGLTTQYSIRYLCQYCSQLKRILFPRNINFGSASSLQQMFEGCFNLSECGLNGATITSSIINTGSMFVNCMSLVEMDMSGWNFSNYTASSNMTNMFRYCFNLTKVVFPASTLVMNANMFDQCYNLKTIIVNATTPPTWAVTTTYLNQLHPNYKIYVPDASVETYKTATGWLNAADHIYGISTYTGD